MITPEIAASIESSVLCWLATVSRAGIPNVSPKEAFLHDGEGRVLIANIASPVSVRNIECCGDVCVSFVDVFLQKGYKITGKARILKKADERFEKCFQLLTSAIGDAFRILSIVEVTPVTVAEILAPSYRLFPDSTPVDRIRESLQSYRVASYQDQARQDSAT